MKKGERQSLFYRSGIRQNSKYYVGNSGEPHYIGWVFLCCSSKWKCEAKLGGE